MPRPPLRIVRFDQCFCIEDAAGRRFAYIYFEEEPGRRNAARLWTEAEAIEIIRRIARAEADRAT